MKRFPFLLVLLAFGAACDSATDPSPDAPNAIATDPITVALFVQDADGNPIEPATVDPATYLYENRAGEPVMAPDGSHITWSEFSTAKGSVSVRCQADGTRVEAELEGLIPNGVYTLWNVTFAEPGFEPTFANLSGVGAAGTSDGSRNAFIADASGRGSLTVTTPAGPLSQLGELGACALTDVFEWHIVGLYHIDGLTHGPDLGPDGTMAEQFAFVFTQ